MIYYTSFVSKRESFLHFVGKKEQNCSKIGAPQLVEVAQVGQAQVRRRGGKLVGSLLNFLKNFMS